MPSLLRLYCNIFEILWLREDLICQAVETQILTGIYNHQIALTNREKFQLLESINFETSSVIKGKTNFVDATSLGSSKLHLAFQEFDSSLDSNLNFKKTHNF